MSVIRIDWDTVVAIVPEAKIIPYLPRKKKKALKKKVATIIINLATSVAEELIKKHENDGVSI